MVYLRPRPDEVDLWETMGSPGWTWESLFPYFLKSENITQEPNVAALYQPAFHGTQGPLHLGFLNWTRPQETDLALVLNTTWNLTGPNTDYDLNSGHPRGLGIYPSTIDEIQQIRWDAAEGYYWPFENRTNLHVQLDTFATRIIWHANQLEPIIAAGVEMRVGDTMMSIRAKREVIIAGGAIQTPALLERSGIGNPRILQQFQIPVQVDLPGVGENLQDRMSGFVTMSSESPITGPSPVAYTTISDLFTSNLSLNLERNLWERIPEYSHSIMQESDGALNMTAIQRLYETQHRLLFQERIPVAEFLFRVNTEAPNTIQVNFLNEVPFSRGNTHISSADPMEPPAVRPRHGTLEWDRTIHVAMAKASRSILHRQKAFNLTESVPGLSEVPADASDEIWWKWLSRSCKCTTFFLHALNKTIFLYLLRATLDIPSPHVVGTSAMMPRSQGGVVDAHMRVYGTANVRVVDASTHPVLLGGHPMSSLYASAERISDIIKADQGISVSRATNDGLLFAYQSH